MGISRDRKDIDMTWMKIWVSGHSQVFDFPGLFWVSNETIGICKDPGTVVAGHCRTRSFLILCVDTTASVLGIIYELQIYPQKILFLEKSVVEMPSWFQHFYGGCFFKKCISKNETRKGRNAWNESGRTVGLLWLGCGSSTGPTRPHVAAFSQRKICRRQS